MSRASTLEAIMKFFAVLASVATVVLMLAICADVASRMFYSRSLPGMVELSETMLTVLIFLSLGYVGLRRAHIHVDILGNALPAKHRALMRGIAEFLTAAFLLWVLYATGKRAITSFVSGEYKFGLLEWPVWPARWVIVFGLALALASAICLAFHHLHAARTGEEIEDQDGESYGL